MDARIVIAAATEEDVLQLGTMFDAYRAFYGEQPAGADALAFVTGQIMEGRSRFFLARLDGALAGFVHLLPSTNTLAMRPIWFLEDLYVTPVARRGGIAAALMLFAEEFARRSGAERLTLATAHDNNAAQALYRKLGYQREEHFEYYHRLLD